MSAGKKKLSKRLPDKPRTLKKDNVNLKSKEESKKPKCLTHKIPLAFDPSRGIWACTQEGCKVVAFPPQQLEKGKPIVGRGSLELVLVRDPEGSRAPLVLLRTLEGNVMLDVTNYVTSMNIEQSGTVLMRDMHLNRDTHVPSRNGGHIVVELSIHNYVDARS